MTTPLALAQLLEQQRRRWRQGDRAPVEAYLPAAKSFGANAVLDLIYNEVMLREEEGDQARLEEYVQRFPHLAEALAIQFEIDGALDESLLGSTAEIFSPHSNSGSPAALPSVPGYEVLAILGRGGMGVVYKARHLALNRLVALKMILAGSHAGPAELARFRQEAEAVARLQHPNIVQVFDFGADEGRPFMALEFVDSSLAQHLTGTPLPIVQAAQWVCTLARAVHHAHQHGIIHRDLKPANILIARAGAVKIADFGMAKIMTGAGAGQTKNDAILGTPSYMAPEQAEGNTKAIGPATDIYGLGAILYELLTGRPPFLGDHPLDTLEQVRRQEPVVPSQLRGKLPRDLETICLHCLAKDPAKRYPDAETLAADLNAFLAGEPIQARRVGPIERWLAWTRRRPTEALLAALALVILTGLVVGALWSQVLAVAAVAALALFADALAYHARLQAALSEATRQRQQAERAALRLHLLFDMTCRLMRTKNEDEALLLLAETTVCLTNAELATIYRLDAARGELISKVTLDRGVGEIRLPLGVGIAGAVAASGEPINVPNAYADPRFNPEVDRRTGHNTRNLLAVPIRAPDGTIVGVFQVINKQDGSFGLEDIEFLSALAESAASAVSLPIGTHGQ